MDMENIDTHEIQENVLRLCIREVSPAVSKKAPPRKCHYVQWMSTSISVSHFCSRVSVRKYTEIDYAYVVINGGTQEKFIIHTEREWRLTMPRSCVTLFDLL